MSRRKYIYIYTYIYTSIYNNKSCLLFRQLAAGSHHRLRDLTTFCNFVGVKFDATITHYVTGTTVLWIEICAVSKTWCASGSHCF